MAKVCRRASRQVPPLSAYSRKLLQFPQAHQNMTAEDWKDVASSDESQFLLRHSDVTIKNVVKAWKRPALYQQWWYNYEEDCFLAKIWML